MLAWIALVGGTVSFFSPCVWPLYPAFLAQLGSAGPRRAVGGASLFTLGFTLIFMALGASASALGRWMLAYRLPLDKVGGILIFALGLGLAGVLPARLLGNPRGVDYRPQRVGPGTSVLLGAAFALGWTPCVGPVLASILLLAAGTAHLGRATLLLGLYSLGFAVPFLVLAAVAARGQRLWPGLGRYLPAVQRISGLLLSALGIMVFTGTLTMISTYLYASLRSL